MADIIRVVHEKKMVERSERDTDKETSQGGRSVRNEPIREQSPKESKFKYRCTECDKTFRWNVCLVRHYQTVHEAGQGTSSEHFGGRELSDKLGDESKSAKDALEAGQLDSRTIERIKVKRKSRTIDENNDHSVAGDQVNRERDVHRTNERTQRRTENNYLTTEAGLKLKVVYDEEYRPDEAD